MTIEIGIQLKSWDSFVEHSNILDVAKHIAYHIACTEATLDCVGSI